MYPISELKAIAERELRDKPIRNVEVDVYPLTGRAVKWVCVHGELDEPIEDCEHGCGSRFVSNEPTPEELRRAVQGGCGDIAEMLWLKLGR